MTTFTRNNDSGTLAGEATLITLQDLGAFTLSAVKDGDGELKLIGWRTSDNTISRLDDNEEAGEVSEIAMTRNLNMTVTAVRDGKGKLKLISWDDGVVLNNITRLKDSDDEGDKAQLIAITNVGGSEAELVTACRTPAKNLKLISWNFESGTGAFKKLGVSIDKEFTVEVIALRFEGRVCITAVVTTEGTLKLSSWRISPDGKTIDKVAENDSPLAEVSAIAMAGSVTAVLNPVGTWKLINWSISPDGATIAPIGVSGEQPEQAIKIAISRISPSRYVTAILTGLGSLKLIAFDVSPSGTVTRSGDSGHQDLKNKEVALTPSLVTAVRDIDGRLKVITWAMQD